MLIKNIARVIIGVYVCMYLFVVYSFSEIIGGFASDYMEYGVGARVMALGGAGRAFSKDATSGYWNAAMLPKIIDVNFSGMNANILDSTKYNHYGISIPFTPNDVVALNYVSMQMAGFELHTADSSNPEGYFNVGNSVAMLSYGRKISDFLSVGITGKYGTRKVYTNEDGVMAVDIGYLLDLNNISFGGNVRNVFSQKFGLESSDTYMMDADFGMLVDFDKLKIGVDVARLMRGNPNVYAGIEYSLVELNDNVNLKCRVGGNTNNDITFGLGALVNPLNFDYAYMIRSTGAEHIFSVGLQFDNNAKALRQQRAIEYYKKAFKFAEENNMEMVIVNLQKGLKEDQDNIDLKGVMKRLMDVKKFGDYASMFEDNAHYMKLYNDSLYAYIINNYDRALENAEYLIIKTGKPKASELRDALESYTKRACKFRNRDMVPQILEEAIASVMVDKLQDANDLLEKAIYLEPNNTTAMKRLGSNYYIKGDKEGARSLWEKVKAINPDDSEVNRLLEQK